MWQRGVAILPIFTANGWHGFLPGRHTLGREQPIPGTLSHPTPSSPRLDSNQAHPLFQLFSAILS